MFLVRENLKTFIRVYPLTVIFVGICFTITILISFMGGYTKENIVLLGGYDKNLIYDGQLWRLLTYSFGHMSYQHFFMNIFIILIFARPLERVLSKTKFLMSFIFTSLCASAIMFYFSSGEYGAGSSGFGFGLWGMYFYLMLKFKNKFYKDDRVVIFLFVTIGFVLSLLIPSVTFSAHFGGFIGGVIFSFLAFKNEKQVVFVTEPLVRQC